MLGGILTFEAQTNNMNFKQQVVWITGASSGIGEYLSYAFSAAGARLVLSSRKREELERVAHACAHPEQVFILPLDVARLDTLEAAVDTVRAHYGAIDILINNAGISQRELALDTQIAVDRQIMDINYFGTIALTKLVAPDMQARKSGQIVVMSSVLGKIGVPYRSAYAASKHALHGFFDSLRAELFPHQVAVTLICPGYVRTNVTINALRGDGSTNQVMAESTSGGFAPEAFAQKALRAIASKKREVVIAKTEGLGVLLHRFVPGIFARIARNMKLK